MATDLQFVRRRHPGDGKPDHGAVPIAPIEPENLSMCRNRRVSKDGRVICGKIVEGDNEVSPNVCRECPYRTVDCAHLQFSLRQVAASPLIVRHNGRTEVWDDGPPQLGFERAACAVKVTPVYDPRSCVGCTLRKSLGLKVAPSSRAHRMAGHGKVVSFPSREALAAAG
jgi:hypothetical protein